MIKANSTHVYQLHLIMLIFSDFFDIFYVEIVDFSQQIPPLFIGAVVMMIPIVDVSLSFRPRRKQPETFY